MPWTLRQKWMFRAILTGKWVVALFGITMTIREILTIPEASSTGLLHLLLKSILTASFWGCCFIGCWYGSIGLHIWVESRRILKNFTSSERKVMSVLCQISQAHTVVYSSKAMAFFLGIIGLLAALLLKDPRWLGLVIMVVSLQCWLWVRTTTPPFILFLSTSDTRSIEVHRQIKRLICPLRVVTLLDLGSSPSTDIVNELHLDCLRTGNDDDWWKVITLLIEMTPLVVINADTESPGVVKEALHLISENITYKTVFLTNGDACLLRREPEPAASASGCYVVSFGMLQGIIKAILDRKELPEQGKTVKTYTSIATNRGSFEGKDGNNSKQKLGQREKMRDKLLLEKVKCCQCKTPMTIFLGVNHKGVFPRQVFVHNSHKGCFQCIDCGRYYCWDCSDSRKPCSCGSMQWQERQYFPAGVSPEQALSGLV